VISVRAEISVTLKPALCIVLASRCRSVVTYCWHNCGDRAGQGGAGPQPSRPLTGGASTVEA
jgi:hypothetical protein